LPVSGTGHWKLLWYVVHPARKVTLRMVMWKDEARIRYLPIR
jgi:hypothetical protein